MSIAEIRTGTMGWSYDDWRGPFYERDAPAARFLESYARTPGFDTVELDTTFYGVPRISTLESWFKATPEHFLFSAKVPRAITHERRLIHADEAAADFGRLLREQIGSRLGALLIQLPPDFTVEQRRILETFLDGVALRHRRSDTPLPWVVEFRSATWAESGISESLAERGIQTATTDRLDLGGPLRYIRLLGVENSVARFDERQIDRSADLDTWAKRLDEARRTPGAESPILVYVRNFFEGHAPATITDLRTRLGLATGAPPGQQQMSLF